MIGKIGIYDFLRNLLLFFFNRSDLHSKLAPMKH